MKKTLMLTTAILGAALAVSSMAMAATEVSAPVPSMHYSAEQFEICDPILLTDSDGDAKKSTVGNSVTAKAISRIVAPDGYFLDTRNGAVAFTQSGTHLNRPGKPRTTKRLNDFLPLELTFKSEAHRGKSVRFGRNAKVFNGIAAYAVKKSTACLTSLGLL